MPPGLVAVVVVLIAAFVLGPVSCAGGLEGYAAVVVVAAAVGTWRAGRGPHGLLAAAGTLAAVLVAGVVGFAVGGFRIVCRLF